MTEAKNTDTVEWQASANGGRWARIVPPKGETLQQRIDYLRQYLHADGTPIYRVRKMVAATGEQA